MLLDLQWVPRDQNEEADALTNEEFVGFDPNLRIPVDVRNIRWEVLPEMFEAAERLYREVQAAKAEALAKRGKAPNTKPGKKLREREPW